MLRRVDWHMIQQYISSWTFQSWNVGKLPPVNKAQRPWTCSLRKLRSWNRKKARSIAAIIYFRTRLYHKFQS